jgi:hypothetical protein
LFDRFDCHEVHRGAACCLDDGLGVVTVVLVRLDERSDILGTDQSYLHAHFLESPRPMVCRTARFHSHDLRTQFSDDGQQICPIDLRAMQCSPAAIGTVELEDTFSQVDTENGNFHDEPPDTSG